MNTFKTIYNESETEIIEKKSRFIANVRHVYSEEDAIGFINKIKAKYWNATHNVFAYVIENNIQRYSDDGEPQGTAGIPVLQTIKNMELQNVAVVVTRYFGGILLGAGGLVRAYGKCAKEGLASAEIVTEMTCTNLEISMEYTLHGRIQNYILGKGYIINNTEFREDVTLSVLVNEEDIESLKKDIMDLTSGNISMDFKGQNRIIVDGNKLLEVITHE